MEMTAGNQRTSVTGLPYLSLNWKTDFNLMAAIKDLGNLAKMIQKVYMEIA